METAPFFAEIADAPEGGRAHWLVAEDGVRIRIGHWVPADAAGTVLLFPGRTEYIEKYGRAARDFATRGFAMAAVDWRVTHFRKEDLSKAKKTLLLLV